MLDHDEMEAIVRELQAAREAHAQEMAQLREDLTSSFRKLDTKVSDVLAEIGGVPDFPDPKRMPLRGRIHAVEGQVPMIREIAEAVARQLADDRKDREELSTVVGQLRAESNRAQIINDERERIDAEHERRWTKRRTRLVTACAVVGGLTAVSGAIFAALTFFGAG